MFQKIRRQSLYQLLWTVHYDEIIALADKIHSDILSKKQTVYLTGEAIIGNDVNKSAQDGLKKTEIITVVLIFGLLLIGFPLNCHAIYTAYCGRDLVFTQSIICCLFH